MFWTILWIPVWIITRPFKGKKDNCLNWALNKWDTDGGYLVIRWCRHNKCTWLQWPHFMWMSEEHNKHIQHIVPEEPLDATHSIPYPWFTYKHVEGDDYKTTEN